jgi:hypothetical protein
MAKSPALPRRRSPKCRVEHPVYELDIMLIGSDPPIWRTVVVRADASLDHLHDVIQLVMPWEECHLHQFRGREAMYVADDDVFDPFSGVGPRTEPSDKTTLRDVWQDLRDQLVYEYDFGDSWEHWVKLIKTHPDAGAFEQLPCCLAGEKAAPPEDSGGVWGFADKLEIVRNPDPNDDWHQDVLEWMGDFDPEAFDVAEANRRLVHARK